SYLFRCRVISRAVNALEVICKVMFAHAHLVDVVGNEMMQ
ncbi:MAG: hypothetical protein ACI90V_010666, partial [Bacillariaceae sp.]